MMDVVSHEFFHIVTFILKKSKISIIMTLKCQSIYGCMKVLPNISLIFSKSIKVNHWRRFYNRLSDQMERECNERHHVFTTMSANVLKQPYNQYINVYQGVIDRNVFGYYEKKSKEERHSWFDAKLANEYGVSKPFNDNELLLKSRL
jgi:hypothetical protein